ncbi:peroxiredoxin [Flavimarina sp. Hel_I_48]|uniref:peroxiredoxin n=1 Tax=Flavimarina sp. Hel_I_48 TaxID=1392488 RepID=UPI0004DFC977|nr:peroxiredoxin [Flavimarina sp. Hel_I_48]
MALKKGDPIPEFELKTKDDEWFYSKDFAGNKPLVIYFYPKNFTPGCTKEACSFRDSYEDFKEHGAEVIGISSDSVASHSRFAKKHELPFIFLADEKGKVRRQFGVKSELFGLLPGRETFVFDHKGTLILKYNSLKATTHIKRALTAIKQLPHEN